MSEVSATRSERWRRRLGRLRPRAGGPSPRARVAALRERGRAAGRRLRRPAQFMLPLVIGVVGALVTVLVYQAVTPKAPQLTPRDMSTSVAQAIASVTPPPAYSSRAYAAIRPSFVLIRVQVPDAKGEDERGLGSGVIITERGDILTALHVVADADAILLTFADGTQSPGQVVAAQEDHDIAVVRPLQPPAQIIPAVLGNPHAMQVGDEVFAVGNPLGLYSSLSAGVVSGFDRSFTPPDSGQKLQGLIQFDAAVNPGNSGGPLLNRYGQVVGIVTGLVNPTDASFFIGIGFAVPIDVAGGAAGLPPY